MDLVNKSNEDATNTEPGMIEGIPDQVDDCKTEVDDLIVKVDNIEQRMNEVEQFFLNTKIKEPNTSKSSSIPKDKEKEKNIPSMKKLQLDASRRQAAATKRMQDLIRQFGTVFRQMTQHKWAWPFMHPVDVEGLGLHDYYQIIDRPMDFTTIKNQMEAKDGTGYKHVREICSDIRLVFKNAMKYNDEKSEVHIMAKNLMAKFEEKWLQFLPKVTDEEKKLEEDKAEAQNNMQLFQEAAHAKMARDINDELHDVAMHIEELREMVVKKCRRISIGEKRKLGFALAKLSPEDLSKALDIVAQNNSNFQPTADDVEVDINAQSESTLWRLKFFVKDVLKGWSDADNNIVSKRKRAICNALAKTAKRRNKNPSS